jgi:hypothetical protein
VTYTGGCHCGKVRYEVDAKIEQVMSCNCSICSKKGYLLAFAPEERFKLVSGAEDLSDYGFGKQVIRHLFCKNCGIGSFGRGVRPDGAKMVAINVRCLDDVDLAQIPVKEFDGRSL